MYNRYIPDDTAYIPVEPEKPEVHRAAPPTGDPQKERRFAPGEGELIQKGKQMLTSLWQNLRLSELDTGDILLLLIVLLLLADGDELDLVIALGLVFLLGMGEKKTGTA